ISFPAENVDPDGTIWVRGTLNPGTTESGGYLVVVDNIDPMATLQLISVQGNVLETMDAKATAIDSHISTFYWKLSLCTLAGSQPTQYKIAADFSDVSGDLARTERTFLASCTDDTCRKVCTTGGRSTAIERK